MAKIKSKRQKTGVGTITHIKCIPYVDYKNYLNEHILTTKLKIDNKNVHIINVCALDAPNTKEKRRKNVVDVILNGHG